MTVTEKKILDALAAIKAEQAAQKAQLVKIKQGVDKVYGEVHGQN